MNGPLIGSKAFREKAIVKSAEASSNITAGMPVALVMNGTDDGIGVVLPATAAAAKATTLFFGVVDRTLAPAEYGHSILFGFVSAARIVRAQTRANSTDPYVTVAAISVGQKLSVNSAQNAFDPGAIGAASDFLAYAVAAQTVASIDSIASTSSDTRTVINNTANMKVFVRAL